MGLNKNKIFGYTALVIAIIGSSLILIGLFKYPEYAIGFSIAGIGFFAIAWAFNALRGEFSYMSDDKKVIFSMNGVSKYTPDQTSLF